MQDHKDNLPVINNASQLFKLEDYGHLMDSVQPADYDRLFTGVKHERVERPENGVSNTASQTNSLTIKKSKNCLDCFETCLRLQETITYDGSNPVINTTYATPEASWSNIDSMRIYINDTLVVNQLNFGQYLHDRVLKKFSKSYIDTFGQCWGVIPNSNTTTLGFQYNASIITADSTAGGGADCRNVFPATSYTVGNGSTSLGAPLYGAGLPSLNYGAVTRNYISHQGTGILDWFIPLYVLHDIFEKLGVIMDPRIETIRIELTNSATAGVSYVKYNGSAQTCTINTMQLQLLYHVPSTHGYQIQKALELSPKPAVMPFDTSLTMDKVCTNNTTNIFFSNTVQAPISHTIYFYVNSNEAYTSRYIYVHSSVSKKQVRINGETVDDGTLGQVWTTNQISKPYKDLIRVLDVDNLPVADSFFTYQNFRNLFPCQATKLTTAYKKDGVQGYTLNPDPQNVEVELTGTFVSTNNCFQVMVCENVLVITPEKSVLTLFNQGKSDISACVYS